MSQEQSNFKVTDRRLFNPDGTPREGVREEEPPAVSATAEASSSAPPPEASRPAASATPTAPTAPEREQERFSEEQSDPDDPTSFLNFLMSIASNAASSLGLMEHPVTGERGVDLPVGKHWIDVLGMLERKTRGNLNREEAQVLEGLLADLRMQFVSLTKAANRPASKGFTANDILGGK
jgi:hypothetical protein